MKVRQSLKSRWPPTCPPGGLQKVVYWLAGSELIECFDRLQ